MTSYFRSSIEDYWTFLNDVFYVSVSQNIMYRSPEVKFVVCCMLVTFVEFQEIVEGQMATCRTQLGIRHIGVDITAEVIPVFDQNNSNFQLHAVFNWTVDFSSLKNGEPPLDGFAVHFLDTKTKRNHSIHHPSIMSTSPCFSGENNAWVTSSPTNMCSTNSDIVSDCHDKPTSSCLCSLSTCDLVNDSRCHSTDFLLTGPDYFQTVPTTIRSLMFPMNFNTEYEFSIAPYYREFAMLAPFVKQIQEIHDCQQFIRPFTDNLAISQALCCEQGAQTLVVHNITFLPPKPTFGATPVQTTVEVNVTWLPPAIETQPSDYKIVLEEQSAIKGRLPPTYENITKIPLNLNGEVNQSNSTDNENCTYVPDYMLHVVLSNLVPGVSYLFEIHPQFDDPQLSDWCSTSLCRTRKYFTAPDVDNLCKEEYGLCAPEAKCLSEFDPNTKRKAKCNCSSGLTGDGLNVTIGQGCFELDECGLNISSCVVEAICTDIKAPNTGVNCTCREGYFGDGYASGSGCSLYALRIILPVVILFILAICLAVLVVWYVKRKRHIKRKMLMEQYVPDDKGILASYEDSGIAKDGGPWDPTFGEAWEIDRANINFGNVIGRGNYGIVHVAWLKKELKTNGISFKNEAAFENGGIYDPVARYENGSHVSNAADENSTLVAVKSLQESNRNHENLYNFMAEIAFMLNIGKHENIVEIYGCSTTEEPVLLITEYLKYGDLLQFLWDAREPTKVDADPIYNVTERSLCTMTRHVANGLTYLQSIRIIHGDIAARNILVGKEGICKISDFGLANDVYRYGAIQGHKERFVPFKWISPERMMSGQVPITYKSDVWSFGNLLYETFTLGCPPHPGIKSGDLLGKLREGYRMKKPKTCNDKVFSLMDKCWKWSPASRPRFNQIVKALDSIIEQLPTCENGRNLAATVEELDRQLYEKEVNEDIGTNDDVYTTGYLSMVGTENENQTRAM